MINRLQRGMNFTSAWLQFVDPSGFQPSKFSCRLKDAMNNGRQFCAIPKFISDKKAEPTIGIEITRELLVASARLLVTRCRSIFSGSKSRLRRTET